MKTILAIVASLMLLSAAAYVAAPTNEDTSNSGVCVVEFNASFNASNSVDWIDDLSDCKGKRVDIAAHPEMQKKYKMSEYKREKFLAQKYMKEVLNQKINESKLRELIQRLVTEQTQ